MINSVLTNAEAAGEVALTEVTLRLTAADVAEINGFLAKAKGLSLDGVEVAVMPSNAFIEMVLYQVHSLGFDTRDGKPMMFEIGTN